MDLVVFGVSGIVVITLAVELLKRFGVVQGDQAIVAAIVVGVVLSVANRLMAIVPGFEAWYQVVVIGALAGFAASGLYDAQRGVRGK